MTSSKQTLKKPVWLKYTAEEIKQIILKLVEKDSSLTAEKIGLVLRDNYGIPKTRLYGFKISSVLKEAEKYQSPDVKNLEKKEIKLKEHLEKNHGDKKTKRSMILTRAKLKIAREYQNSRKK